MNAKYLFKVKIAKCTTGEFYSLTKTKGFESIVVYLDPTPLQIESYGPFKTLIFSGLAQVGGFHDQAAPKKECLFLHTRIRHH